MFTPGTIFIPTGDFVGLLNDVMALAGQDKEDPATYAVCIQWDGKQVHAMATDDMRLGVSSWDPDDLPEEALQESVFARRGGQGDPWKIVISLPDAGELAKKFKVSEKNAWVPLALDYVPGITDEHKLRVSRNTDCGLPGLSMVVLDRPVQFADVRALLDVVPLPQPVEGIEFNGEALAGFGQVRQRGGGMKLTFTGTESIALVTVGERFRGGIQPIRSQRRRLASVA